MADIAQLGIEIDTRKLKSGEKDLASFSNSAKTATSAIAAFIGAASVSQLIKIADGYAQMEAKVSRYTKSQIEANATLQQLTGFANKSGSAVSDAVNVFNSLTASLESVGASKSQIMTVTEEINKLGVIGGSSVDDMRNSMRQFGQSMAGGVVRAEEFNSIIENTPEIARSIAAGMGVSMAQLRQDMLAGKLTSDAVFKALLSQVSTTNDAFAKMPRTVSQAMGQLANNFQVVVGELNKTTGATAALSAGLDSFSNSMLSASNHTDEIITGVELLALAYGSKLAGALTTATAEKLKAIAASQAVKTAIAAEAEAVAIASTTQLRKVQADKLQAQSAVAVATAEYNVAKGSSAEALALDALISAKSRLVAASATVVEAEIAQTAAIKASGVAAKAASVSMGILNGAMALLGGPAGVVILAVSAIYMWASAAEDARQEAIEYADGVDTATASLRNMTSAQLAASQVKLAQSIDAQAQSASELRAEVEELQDTVNKQIAVSKMLGNATAANTYEMDQLKLKSAELEAAESKLSQMRSKSYAITQTLNGNLKDNYVAMQNSNSVTGIASGIQSVFNGVLDTGNKLLQQRNNYVLLGNGAKSNLTATDQKYLTQLENEIALEKELDPIKRARIKAEQEAAAQGLSASGTTQYINQSVKLAEIQAKNDAASKALTASYKSEASAIKEASKNAEEYARFSQEISRFNATEAQQIQNWQADQLKQLELFHKAGVVSEQNFAWAKQGIIDESNRRLQKLNDDQWSEYLNGSSAALLKLKQQAQTQLTGPKQQIVVSGIDQKLKEQTFSGLPTIDAGSQTNEQNQIAQLQTQTTAMNDAYNQRIADYQRFRSLEVENAAYYDGQIAALEKKKEENNKNAQAAMLNLQLSAGEAMAASAADSFN